MKTLKRCLLNVKCRNGTGVCCAECDKKNCDVRCLNHPDRCKCWEPRNPKSRVQSKGPKEVFSRKQIVALYHEGWTRAEIADCMGCCVSTVGKVLLRAGIRERNSGPIDKNKMLSLYWRGASRKEIAGELGCSYGGVCRALREELGP